MRFKETIINTFRRVGLSLKTDGSEDAEIQIKELEGIAVGDWQLPVEEMQSQETEAHEAMPLFAEARAQKAQDKKDRSAVRRAVRQAAKHAVDAAQGGEGPSKEVPELREELTIAEAATPAVRRQRVTCL